MEDADADRSGRAHARRAEALACSTRPRGWKPSRHWRPSLRRSSTRTRRRSRASRDVPAPRLSLPRRGVEARDRGRPEQARETERESSSIRRLSVRAACPASRGARGRRILHQNKDREDGVQRAVMRSIVAAVAVWFAPCASVLAQDYPTRTVRIIIPLGPGGGRRHIHPRARGRIAEGAASAGRGREQDRRRAQHRDARLRGGSSRRLHHLRPVERAGHLQPIPLQEPPVRSRQGLRADQQPVLQHAGAGRQQFAKGAHDPGSRGLGQGSPRHAQLRHVFVSACAFHGELKKETGADIVGVPFRSGSEVVTAVLSGSTRLPFSRCPTWSRSCRAATSWRSS